MKLLLFSDLHCDIDAADDLVQLSSGVDLALGAGDFASGRHGINLCIDVLRDLVCPAVIVPGNNESFDELRAACIGWEQVSILHATGVTIQGVSFFGLGGGVPVTPFGSWSYDFSEADAAKLLKDFPSGGVLISHSPPLGILDRGSSNKNLGSSTVRALIDSHQPQLIVCGHIHACGGRTENLGSTIVVNAGPAGVIIDLPTR